MLKRDLILVQIEELGKVIAQLIDQRNNDVARKNPGLVQVVYNSLQTDRQAMLSTSPDELRQILNRTDNAGLQRLELAAKTLLEEQYLYPTLQKQIREKAKELFEYIQREDNTYSLERVAILDELRNQ